MPTKRLPPTPWERIVRAADQGTGLRLTYEDVVRLSQDGAIQLRASEDSLARDEHERGLHDVDPSPECYCREVTFD